MNTRPIRLLHVDDDHEFVEFAASVLRREREAFEIETASDVSTALDHLDRETVDCVISGYELPGQTGLDFLRTVRESNEDLPFVLVTGHGAEEIAADAISAGVSDYRRKTREREQYADLATRIENLVARYRNQRRQRQLVRAVEITHEGIAFVDSDGTVGYANQAFAETVGDTVSAVTDSAVEELVAANAFEERIRPALSDGEWTGEVLIARRDGTKLLVDTSVSPTAGDEFVWTVRPVAADDRDHELFVKDRAMDAAPVGITLTDPERPNNGIVYVNDKFEHLTGYTQSEIAGENHRLLQGPETDPEAVATLRAAIDAAEPVTVEIRNYRKDGTPFWNRVSVAPIHDTEGSVTNFVGFQQDVTELIEARGEREAVLDRVSDAFFALDTEWRFTYLNDQAERVLDRPREELVGQSVWDEFPEAVDSAFFEEYERAMETQETVAFEEYYSPLSAWFEVRAYPSTSGLSVYFRDVSGRKASERQLEQRAKQFERFGDVLAHDLRTPLMTLHGRLQLARETGDEEQFDAAEDAFERIDTLINELATAMREGSVVNDLEPVDVERVVENLWTTLDTADATIETGGPIVLRADERALARLVQNLLQNAVEHGGPTVTVTVGPLDGCPGFFVADDGPGIPADERENVFEPGYSTRPNGTGFGMVSARQVALAHGWELSVTESERGGARFEVRSADVPDDSDRGRRPSP